MPPEAEQVIDQILIPGIIKLVILGLIGTAAFTKKKIHPVLRIVLIGLSLAMLAWMWLPTLK